MIIIKQPAPPAIRMIEDKNNTLLFLSCRDKDIRELLHEPFLGTHRLKNQKEQDHQQGFHYKGELIQDQVTAAG